MGKLLSAVFHAITYQIATNEAFTAWRKKSCPTPKSGCDLQNPWGLDPMRNAWTDTEMPLRKRIVGQFNKAFLLSLAAAADDDICNAVVTRATMTREEDINCFFT